MEGDARIEGKNMVRWARSYDHGVVCVSCLVLLLALVGNGQMQPRSVPVYNSSYRAAIVEFAPRGQARQSAQLNLQESMAAVEAYVAQAARAHVDILIFPEAVLWTWGLVASNPREEIKSYGETIPPVRTIPCSAPADTHLGLSVSRNASCISKQYNITLVINTIDVRACDTKSDPDCPADGRYQLNTDVVFEGQSGGMIMAIYHKYHLYGTYPILDRPRNPEVVSYTSIFGVKFGLFICFDIDFRHPVQDLLHDGVSHFIYSTWWENSPPIFTATMFQQAFSRTFSSVLLAANTGESYLNSGSGIFVRGTALGVHFNATEFEQDTFIWADVPKTLHTIPDSLLESRPPPPTVLQTEVSKGVPCEYASPSLVKKGYCLSMDEDEATYELKVSRNFSCSVTAKFKNQRRKDQGDVHSYVLWGSDGEYQYNTTESSPMVIQNCAVFHCEDMVSAHDNHTARVCAPTYNATAVFYHIDLKGTFSETADIYGMVSVEGAQIVPNEDVQLFDQNQRLVWDNKIQHQSPSAVAENSTRDARLFSAVLLAISEKLKS